MARKFLVAVDLNKNELQNARVQNLGSAPGTPVTGQIYYNTGDNTLYWWNGSGWVAAKDAGATSIYYQTVKDDGTARTQRAALNFVSTTSVALTATDDGAGDETEITADVQFGAVTSQTTFGASSGNGAANTAARSDHTHGTPAHNDAAHSGIALSALAVPTADVSFNSRKITNLATPTAATDAATKGYVDNAVVGIDWKPSVRAATTTNGTLASAFQNGSTVDGVTLATGDRILLKNQSTAAENGLYTVNATGAPTRATDADGAGEVTAGMAVFVEEGTTNGDTAWVLTNNGAITIGTTGLTFVQFAGGGAVTAGDGMTQSGNTLNVVAGNGISVAADSVAVDTAVVVRKYAATIGDGVATSIAVTHNLGTKDITYSIRQVADDAFVEADAVATSTTQATFTFATAPAASALRVTVHG